MKRKERLKIGLDYLLHESQRRHPSGSFFLIAAFCRLAKLLSYSEQMGWLVGAVGIELKVALKPRKLLILRTGKMATPREFA